MVFTLYPHRHMKQETCNFNADSKAEIEQLLLMKSEAFIEDIKDTEALDELMGYCVSNPRTFWKELRVAAEKKDYEPMEIWYLGQNPEIAYKLLDALKEQKNKLEA